MEAEFTRADIQKLGSGVAIYTLDGSSLSQISGGIRYNALEGYVCNSEQGVSCEVAIFPKDPFVKGTLGRNAKERAELVNKYSKELDLSSGEAVVGKIATLAGVLIKHAEETGEWLLPWEYVGSSTVVQGPYLAHVGFSVPDRGFIVYDMHRDDRDDGLGALRLVVATGK